MAQASKGAAEPLRELHLRPSPLRAPRSYADVLKGSDDEMSDIEMSDGGRRAVTFNQRTLTSYGQDPHRDGTSVVAPKRRKKSPERDNPERDSKTGEGSKATVEVPSRQIQTSGWKSRPSEHILDLTHAQAQREQRCQAGASSH